MPLPFTPHVCYPTGPHRVHWRGQRILDALQFESYLKGPVRARVGDLAHEEEFAQDLEALATTEMATSTLASVLSSTTSPLDWEVGEALAECLLGDEFGAEWPWNESRDKKTPRASLPGADIVGFLNFGGKTIFLFGEVKTSSDKNCPPNVMSGRSGLKHQIDALSSDKKLHRSLLIWLRARCKNTSFWEKYQQASTNYLSSGGKNFAIVGVLLRDTEPSEMDLKTRGSAIALAGSSAPSMRLDAWYLPRKIDQWSNLVTST